MSKDEISVLARKAASVNGKEFFSAYEVASKDHEWSLIFNPGSIEVNIRPKDFGSDEEIIDAILRQLE